VSLRTLYAQGLLPDGNCKMTISTREFDYVRKLVLDRSALVLDRGKEYLVESRLNLLASREGFTSLRHLLECLSADSSGDLQRKVVEAMVTHETTFFRDLRPFEILRTVVIPELLVRRASTRSLHIWSAASAGGQEPYSIAMLLHDHFPSLVGWNMRLIASDISRAALERAREGRFTQIEINRGLPAAMLVRHFQKTGGDWQIRASLRRMVEFREINLAHAWPALPCMDVIFMRNVLIYFGAETRNKILGRVCRLLRSDGYFFLGASEATINLDERFELLPHDRAVCFRLIGTHH
jgi:chemotaxis protein methyltransferase CheR